MALSVFSVLLWPVHVVMFLGHLIWEWVSSVAVAPAVVGVNNGGGAGINVGHPAAPVAPVAQPQLGPANAGIGHNVAAQAPVVAGPGGPQAPQAAVGIGGPAAPAPGVVHPPPAAVAGPANQGGVVGVGDWVELDAASGLFRLTDEAPREVQRLFSDLYPESELGQQLLRELSTRSGHSPSDGVRLDPMTSQPWYIAGQGAPKSARYDGVPR